MTQVHESMLYRIQPDLAQGLGQGFNAVVSRCEYMGQPAIEKKFSYEGKGRALNVPIDLLVTAYLAYHEAVGEVFAVPQIYETRIDGASQFTSVEQFISGVGGHTVAQRGNLAEIEIFSDVIFRRLASTRISPISLAEGIVSLHPMRVPIDTKPDNFVIDTEHGLLYCIDFMPPRVRDKNGLVALRDEALDNRNNARITMLYGDLVVQMTRFWTRMLARIGDEPDHACERIVACTHIFRRQALEADPSGKLLADIFADLTSTQVESLFSADKGVILPAIYASFAHLLDPSTSTIRPHFHSDLSQVFRESILSKDSSYAIGSKATVLTPREVKNEIRNIGATMFDRRIQFDLPKMDSTYDISPMNILGIPDFADMGLMSGPEVIEYLNDAFGLQEPFDGERQIPLARITRLLSLLQTDAVISDVQTRLQEIARNHQDEKVRRSALYSLAYLPLGEQLRRDGIVNFIIGSLQDESIEVQKQALAIVSSEKFAPLLHANQAKKILSNIDLPLTDWVFKQHIREAMQKIGRYSHDWDDMDDKPAILMFPGSFNPPHEGHLESAEGAAALVGREVWISVNAIEDEKIVQPFDIRCLMVRKSIADNPAVYLVPEYLMKDQGGLWIKSRRARVNQLIPFASDIGMVRGADVLENRSYTNLDSLTREIFHVICDRGDEAGTREVLRQLDLAYPVLHTELHSSTDVRILFAEGRVDQAFSQLHPLVAQYLRKHRLYG